MHTGTGTYLPNHCIEPWAQPCTSTVCMYVVCLLVMEVYYGLSTAGFQCSWINLCYSTVVERWRDKTMINHDKTAI